MEMDFWEVLLMSLSLSVDSMVVSMGGSMSLRNVRRSRMFGVASVFGLVQAGLFFAGWGLSASLVSLIQRAAHVIGFILMLYIGLSMIREAFRGDGCDRKNLVSLRMLMTASVVTSIDAAAVGASLAMSGLTIYNAFLSALTVGAVTLVASFSGIVFGCRLGAGFGRPARVAGGIVLVIIGCRLLCGALS